MDAQNRPSPAHRLNWNMIIKMEIEEVEGCAEAELA